MSSGGSQGGLAVGVMNALQKNKGLWVGWSGEIDQDTDAQLIHYTFDSVRFATFPLTEHGHQAFYIGFSNEVLWPLFHYRTEKVVYDRTNQKEYLHVNQRYARHVATLVEPHSRIWVHDYQLIPLGHFLRQAGIDAPIGYFLHTPFPPWDVLRILPDYENLLRYFSAYDVIGFQTKCDLRNFEDCIRHGLDATFYEDGTIEAEGRCFRAEAYPISIDLDTAQEMARQGVESNTGKRMANSLLDRAIIMGVDRLDYSKGIYKRFQAFERLLEKAEHQHGHVVFVQISPPSRTDVPEYAELRTSLERLAGHVNGRFSDYDWTPLRYLNRGYSRESILGFLRLSRVGFLTPLRDGMNLVAKEFVAAQDPEDPGVLVLSHLAGASWELQEGALVCNPYDAEGVADMLDQALVMPLEERKARWQQMIEVLRKNDIHYWCQKFLDSLGKAS
ncbi:trehalose-6-phosphate synthase [Modicisalibacter luteus]|uniref:Trehalose-6-phosphate synthase n=3 Tax=Modicisalibacter luteus TaxID=453962 RepID=A0ABV7M749_9GAMM|nr:trehalose-6-phosphate synthase [Halomonas lutea]